MTEDEARGWIEDRFGTAAAGRLAFFGEIVASENTRQNLVAPSTLAQMWNRHLLDSAQLVPLARGNGPWLDIGTGGGFPGLVVASLVDHPVILVEPRRKRADFLIHAAERLGLRNTRVEIRSVEKVTAAADTISARAVGSVEKLLQAAAHCVTPTTRWILPRGTVDPQTLEACRRGSHRMFHVEQSLSDSASSILLIDEGVAA